MKKAHEVKAGGFFKLCFLADFCYTSNFNSVISLSCSTKGVFVMDFSFVKEWLQYLETEQVMSFLEELNLGELIYNQWFLGGLAVFTLVTVYLRRYTLLATVLLLVGFAALVDHTLQRGTQVENIMSDTLLVFVGGGLVLIFAVIYLLFIRHD